MPKVAKAPLRSKVSSARVLRALPIARMPEPPVSKETLRYREVVTQIEKRDGRLAPFDFDKIVTAIEKAMAAASDGSHDDAVLVAHQVAGELSRFAKKYKTFLPTVEGIQDSVEKYLIVNDYVKAAKAYILYRDKRAQLRATRVEIPEHVQKLAEESKKYFAGNELGEFVYLRTYAKWIPEEGRRETWIETVDRYIAFMRENLGTKLTEREYSELREAILKQEVMGSMRLMQFAGEAARRCNTCAYNCTFTAPTKLEDFAEILYLSSRGCGVGFAVESRNIEQLPQIMKQTGEKLSTHLIEDSAEGWGNALTFGLKTWYAGKDVDFDYSHIRPAGTRLKVMGGKASGPAPLQSLLAFTREKVLARQGRRLRNIDAHDVICKIGEAIVSGGVRRTAMISLSDLDDEMLRDAKKGQFYMTDPHRSLAKSLPKRRVEFFNKRGFINSDGAVEGPIGTNPCAEIVLQSKQFCNLSEVIARAEDTEASLVRKARLAAILGTYQSTLTNFRYISKEWTDNCGAESLLGVSTTGEWDSPAFRNPETMRKMRDMAVKTNATYAKRLGVNP